MAKKQDKNGVGSGVARIAAPSKVKQNELAAVRAMKACGIDVLKWPGFRELITIMQDMGFPKNDAAAIWDDATEGASTRVRPDGYFIATGTGDVAAYFGWDNDRNHVALFEVETHNGIRSGKFAGYVEIWDSFMASACWRFHIVVYRTAYSDFHDVNLCRAYHADCERLASRLN